MACNDAALCVVDVVYALPDIQTTLRCRVAKATTARAVVLSAQVRDALPLVDLAAAPLGIWGKAVAGDHVVHDGDRVEIYRQLPSDPRERRRQLAAMGKTMGQS